MLSSNARRLGQYGLLSTLMATAAIGGVHAAAARTPAGPAPIRAKMAWWRDARFGLFIHWGPVSLTGQEISWSRANSNPKCPNNGGIPIDVYDNLYQKFNPTQFDAKEWVNVARRAGMKYMVLTAKHCDGFLLWPSQASGYNMSATPYHKDICGALSDAAHQQGMKIGWYYSPMDWRDPDFRTARNAAFVGRMHTELHELLSNYGKIDMLWFDWDCGDPAYDQPRTYRLVKSLQPKILIDNRLDLGPHSNNREILSPNADYYTPEQELSAYDDQRPWESCMTLGEQWSWKPNDKLKSVPAVVRALASCAGGDGNLLLDVGPMPDGRIEPRQVTILNGVGDWLKTHGASIYGTRGGPYKPAVNYVSTRKGNTIYIHVLGWNGAAVSLPALPARIVKATVLGGGSAAFQQSDDSVRLTVPAAAHDAGDTVVALTLAGSAMRLAPIESVFQAGAASASNVFQNQGEYGPDKAFDGNDKTRWAADGGAKTAWLQWDYAAPTRINGVTIAEAYAGRVTSFQIQYRPAAGGSWITAARGTHLGEEFHCAFPPVTARAVRLQILDATDGPTITEMKIQTAK
ncbi:hypothetical protein CCAX7_58220 [Capsulimonas corticalis]|uniref:alpha-L-fucosidase n=1 Tax=Capsulimonas corticalis TaxID=2219043 RepID=A0A402D005_9BACT|nr:alpha-L-fucosidase [Capsulimonas corticalis]BDI33771.1 hypothetical protein CCAX7_58220 [Capsulimonas corticalis]